MEFKNNCTVLSQSIKLRGLRLSAEYMTAMNDTVEVPSDIVCFRTGILLQGSAQY